MILIIDYGMGNLRSVSKALESLGASVRISSDPVEVASAQKLILPGVGAFPAAMHELAARKLIEPIKASIARGTPFLGICLGLQVLFEKSEEGEGALGLGVLPGMVRRFAFTPKAGSNGATLKIPHMGWNQLIRTGEGCPLLKEIPEGSFVYFVHSYYADPRDRSVTYLESDYGGRFSAMIWRDNLYGTQFHPEKSQAVGLQLLKNIIAL